VCEDRGLKRIFGPRRNEMTGVWRKLHNEFDNLYSSPSIIRMMKSRMMRWAGNVRRKEKKRKLRGYWLESQKERNHKMYVNA
jgi:hypothetical protein